MHCSIPATQGCANCLPDRAYHKGRGRCRRRTNWSISVPRQTSGPPGIDRVCSATRAVNGPARSQTGWNQMKKAIRNEEGAAAAAGQTFTEVRRQAALLKTGALQDAIFNSANFSSIATDEKGVIQIFNVGAERMLGYAAADVLNK